MSNRRISLHGLLAVLFALMAQLGTGASVPRLDPLARIVGAEIPCHASNGASDTPGPGPMHPLDCLVCPLCVALHTIPATLAPDTAAPTPTVTVVVLRPELPPPATAPPRLSRAPHQPRAPPAVS